MVQCFQARPPTHTPSRVRLHAVILCPTAQHSMWYLLRIAGALISLFSGSLGQSDILSAKSDAEKNLCLSCPLKNRSGEGCLLLTKAQQYGER